MSHPDPPQPDNPPGNQPSDQWGRPEHWGSASNWGTPAQPQSSPSAADPQQQSQPSAPPSGQPPGQGPGGPGQSYGQPPAEPPPSRSIADANPFKAAFDFSFNSYATPGLVKIIYVLATILAIIWWIGGTIMVFITGSAFSSLNDPYGESGGAGGVVLGIIALLLGWIPALLWLLIVRIALEASMALVRLADDMRHIRRNAGA